MRCLRDEKPAGRGLREEQMMGREPTALGDLSRVLRDEGEALAGDALDNEADS
jgi:hypothetical protein